MENKRPETTDLEEYNDNQLELNLKIPKTLRTEFNFLKYPFFDLAKDSTRNEIKIEETVETKDGTSNLLWYVSRGRYFPGDFEKRLHRAIEQIINVTPKPIKNPLRLGSLRSIAKLMGINQSGFNLANIKKAFKTIVATTIETKGTFQVKDGQTRRHVNDVFHLYDRVIYIGEELPDDKGQADCTYLMLGSWYLNNINQNYVVPLNWHFYVSLNGTITTRLYEFLSINFFIALEQKRNYQDIPYSQICAYFPLTKQYPRWKAKKQLKQAHEILVEKEYIAKVEWHEGHEKGNWQIRYFVGPKAQHEYQQNKKETLTITKDNREALIPAHRRRKRLSSEGQGSEVNSKTITKLVKRGISRRIAEQLTGAYPEEVINQKTEVFDFLVESNSKKVKNNPPGFLRKSIEDDYAIPPNYVSQQEKELRDQKIADNEKHRRWQEKVEQYRRHLDTTPESLVYGQTMLWEIAYKKENNNTAPSPSEKAAKQQELIDLLPEPKELQKQIFGQVIFTAQTAEQLEQELIKLPRDQEEKMKELLAKTEKEGRGE